MIKIDKVVDGHILELSGLGVEKSLQTVLDIGIQQLLEHPAISTGGRYYFRLCWQSDAEIEEENKAKKKD